MFKFQPTLTASLLLLLTACSDGGSSGRETGSFNLGVSDAPVDDASEVVLFFNHVVLVPQDGGDAIVIDLGEESGSPHSVDLLTLQGSAQEIIVSDRELFVGDYRMCLYALDGDGSDQLSYVNLGEATGEPEIVSLKVNNKGACHGTRPDTSAAGRLSFDKGNELVTINTGVNNFVAEFDLRKGLVDPVGQSGMFIKPNSVQLINIAGAGSISGVLDATQAQACEADLGALTGATEFRHAVYLYAGSRDRSTMGDIVGDPNEEGQEGFPPDSLLVEPVATAAIDETSSMYQFGFIGEGTYSIGYTCVAVADMPTTHETLEEGFAVYQHYTPVEVLADEDTAQDIYPILP